MKTSTRSTCLFLISILFASSAVFASETPQIKEGAIQKSDHITFKKDLSKLGINYLVSYLPNESAEYNKKVYQVTPTSIWWHWDAGPTPKTNKNIAKRVKDTYNILVDRTKAGERVSTNFSVGPNTVLQMLPMSATAITQGRLTNDLKIEDINLSKSLGGIQIETTGTEYDVHEPLASQTDTMIKLTAVLMKQYNIPFSNIYGHLERAPGIGKTDPGINYLKKNRIKLLKYLIKNKQFQNIGSPDTWNFYTEVEVDSSPRFGEAGKIEKVLDQSSQEILNRMTKQEKALLK